MSDPGDRTYQAAILQLPLQQAVQGEGHDVIQILHLQKVEIGVTPWWGKSGSWSPRSFSVPGASPSSITAPGRVKEAGSGAESRILAEGTPGLVGAGCKMSDKCGPSHKPHQRHSCQKQSCLPPPTPPPCPQHPATQPAPPRSCDTNTSLVSKGLCKMSPFSGVWG